MDRLSKSQAGQSRGAGGAEDLPEDAVAGSPAGACWRPALEGAQRLKGFAVTLGPSPCPISPHRGVPLASIMTGNPVPNHDCFGAWNYKYILYFNCLRLF